MFKAEIHNDTTEEILTMAELKPCQLAIIVDIDDMGYKGPIVMRTASQSKFEVMDLSISGSDCCWTEKQHLHDIKVKLLPKGTKVTLTVE